MPLKTIAPPTTHGSAPPALRLVKGNAALTANDYALIGEALRIAHDTLLETADIIARRLPLSQGAERFRLYAENMGDLATVVAALVRRA